MKILTTIVLLIAALFSVSGSALALERPSSSAGIIKGMPVNIKEKVQEKVSALKDKLVEKKASKSAEEKERKQNVLGKLQGMISAREANLDRIASSEGKLLDKLQIRVDQAQIAGKDTASMSALLKDGRDKLAAANSKLTKIGTEKASITTKVGFLNLQKEFKSVQVDLIAVRKDAALIISQLKGFNSATSEGKNPQNVKTTPIRLPAVKAE